MTEQKPFENKATGLDLLRKPFPKHQVSHLPKGTKAQNSCPNNEKKTCIVCGGWHHPQIIHLDYVGHAALTDRLLDADPLWMWEPFALKEGLPAFDATGGLWIRLTVCGHTRIGYGHAESSEYKEIGSREKEVIGDALRNAAMRFGAALDLWHKGELHLPEDNGASKDTGPSIFEQWEIRCNEAGEAAKTLEDIIRWWPDNSAAIKKELPKAEVAKIYEIAMAHKNRLKATEREPGQEG